MEHPVTFFEGQLLTQLKALESKRFEGIAWHWGVGNPAKPLPGALWLCPKVPPSSLLSMANIVSLAQCCV